MIKGESNFCPESHTNKYKFKKKERYYNFTEGMSETLILQEIVHLATNIYFYICFPN